MVVHSGTNPKIRILKRNDMSQVLTKGTNPLKGTNPYLVKDSDSASDSPYGPG
ncbi:hypothetical protein AVEN_230124-1, partial [Araneus ventricosus]